MINKAKDKVSILVSACLLGVHCNYKGGTCYDFTKNSHFWSRITEKYNIIPICPEQLGGLPTPRIASELQGKASDVEAGTALITNKEGADVTKNYVKGAEESLLLARVYKVKMAVLKSNSPSCGKKNVHDGTFSGVLIPGFGYTAYLLNKAKIEVLDEEEFVNKEKCTLKEVSL